jgi:hypothetical protein
MKIIIPDVKTLKTTFAWINTTNWLILVTILYQSKARTPGFQRIQWVKVRDCSFCWYWWNCLPSPFRFSLQYCTMGKTLSFLRNVISWELSDVMATSLFLPIKIYFSLVNQRLLKFPVSIVISKGVNWPWPVFYIYMGLLYLYDGLDLPIWPTRHYSTDSVPSFHLDTITIYVIGTFFFGNLQCWG